MAVNTIPGRRGDFVEMTALERASTVPILYAFTIGAVNFGGVFYLDSASPKESFCNGGFAGAVVGTYHIDRNNVEACANNGPLNACVKIDFSDRKLCGRICTHKVTGGWDSSGWEVILSW